MASSADAIQSFLERYEQRGANTTQAHGSGGTVNGSKAAVECASCCCGNDGCAYLKQNVKALEGLEKDVRTAAQLGQALLMRHETYIADSERERKAMTVQIETLETEKAQLEKRNATVIEENRDLLDQLEAVNNAVTDSDTHVTSLQATLLSTQQELQRLAQLAARTERLEQQLQDYEREQAEWQTSFDAKEQSERSAVRRWQQAERTLADLQEQMDRIEKEAREDKERHVEIVGRMERRHAVETELTTAAGRLKGAAAARTSGRDPGGTNVVSHFVKDILQDNANLQMGIVELRDMLQNSNDEVESLRRQVEDHQPTPTAGEHAPSERTKTRQDLREELQRTASQELHVHHHYHAPASSTKAPTVRRPKKKRYGALTPGHFTPPSGYSTPRSSFSYGTPSSAATILQQTAVSIPQPVPTSQRSSAQSNMTYQSMLSTSGPASPQSTTNRTSSLFDRVFSDAGHESSRPTTPDSEDLGSPIMAPIDSKRGGPKSSFRTHSAPIVPRRSITPSAGRPSMDSVLGTSLDQAFPMDSHLAGHDAIPEEEEAEWENASSPADENDSSVSSPLSDELLDPIHSNADIYRPTLRRAASHESLLSVSGMDIHTLKTRPSQLLAGTSGGRSFSSRAAGVEVSNTNVHAAWPTATLSRPSGSGRSILSGMAAEQRLANKSSMGFGSKVGGWMFSKWGATPAPATAAPATSAKAPRVEKTSVSSADKDNSSGRGSKPTSRPSTSETAAIDPEATPKKLKARMPGINQAGPILGFAPAVKLQRPPVMRSLDEEGLRRALGD